MHAVLGSQGRGNQLFASSMNTKFQHYHTPDESMAAAAVIIESLQCFMLRGNTRRKSKDNGKTKIRENTSGKYRKKKFAL